MRPKVLSLCSYIVLAFSLLFLAIIYQQITPTIPLHYGIVGEANSWGAKNNLWYLAIGGIVVNVGLTLLTKRPDLYNYPCKVTDNNRDRIYAASTQVVASLQLTTTLILAFVIVMMTLSVERIPRLIYALLLLSPFVNLVWGIRKVLKAGKEN